MSAPPRCNHTASWAHLNCTAGRARARSNPGAAAGPSLHTRERGRTPSHHLTTFPPLPLKRKKKKANPKKPRATARLQAARLGSKRLGSARPPRSAPAPLPRATSLPPARRERGRGGARPTHAAPAPRPRNSRAATTRRGGGEGGSVKGAVPARRTGRVGGNLHPVRIARPKVGFGWVFPPSLPLAPVWPSAHRLANTSLSCRERQDGDNAGEKLGWVYCGTRRAPVRQRWKPVARDASRGPPSPWGRQQFGLWGWVHAFVHQTLLRCVMSCTCANHSSYGLHPHTGLPRCAQQIKGP